MRNTIANCVLECAKTNPNFFLISGDAGLGVWDSYKEDFKSQYINPGVNEALCVGMAAGMALCGKKVVYYNIAPFVIMRPYEQVRNDICYQNVPVILVGTGSGITYMPSGMTHYAIEDIALALTMPNLQIFSPCDSLETKSCFKYAYCSTSPSYIRIPKAGEPLLHTENENIDISKPQILYKCDSSTLLLSHSSITKEVLEAGKEAGASVASVPFINSKDNSIIELMQQFKTIIVVEEHYTYGGLGTFLSQKIDKKIHQIALPNEFIHLIGNQNYAREHYGLSTQKIVEFVKRVSNG